MSMAKVQKVYTRAFKEQAVQLAQTSGKSIAEARQRTGYLRHVYSPMAEGAGSARQRGISRQRTGICHERRKTAAIPRELERVQQERAILKKVVSIFSRESK
jgi:transposase